MVVDPYWTPGAGEKLGVAVVACVTFATKLALEATSIVSVTVKETV